MHESRNIELILREGRVRIRCRIIMGRRLIVCRGIGIGWRIRGPLIRRGRISCKISWGRKGGLCRGELLRLQRGLEWWIPLQRHGVECIGKYSRVLACRKPPLLGYICAWWLFSYHMLAKWRYVCDSLSSWFHHPGPFHSRWRDPHPLALKICSQCNSNDINLLISFYCSIVVGKMPTFQL